MAPKVSIAVITYNQAPLLRECLESIAAQTYQNLEVVVADDASTDDTPEVLREFQDRLGSRLVVVRADRNEGITANSNRAHHACTGELVAWIGGDDVMFPTKIEKQVAFMEAHPDCVVSYHNLDVFLSDTGASLGEWNRRNRYEGGVEVAIRRGTFNGASSTMVRRAATPPGGFDPRVPIASDWLYWVETLGGGGTIRYLDEVLGRYRRHANNVTAGAPAKRLRNVEDHIVSAAIILSRFPRHARAARSRLAELLHDAGRAGGDAYPRYLLASLGTAVTWRAAAALLLHLASGGKIRK